MKRAPKILHAPVSILLIMTLSLSGCASSGKNGQVELDLPVSEEIELGKKIHQQILSNYYVYTKPDVVTYVNEVENKLTELARRKLPYEVTILYNEEIYANSAPGGYIYITTGMIHFLQNEAELAAILAHEIGRLQYKDPAFSSTRKFFSDMASTGAAVAPVFGQIGMLAALGFVLIHAASHSEGKKADDRLIEADALALDYLTTSGYDPQALLDILHRFIEADKGLMAYFLDYYHIRPISKERMLKLREKFSGLSLDGKELVTRPRVYQDAIKAISEIYRRP